jgi:hypothetical protein
MRAWENPLSLRAIGSNLAYSALSLRQQGKTLLSYNTRLYGGILCILRAFFPSPVGLSPTDTGADRARLWFVTSTTGHAQRWCCPQKRLCSGSPARTVVHAVHSMNSKRLETCADPTTEACPKFWGVISYQQRLQTGGLACNRMPPVGAAGS